MDAESNGSVGIISSAPPIQPDYYLFALQKRGPVVNVHIEKHEDYTDASRSTSNRSFLEQDAVKYVPVYLLF